MSFFGQPQQQNPQSMFAGMQPGMGQIPPEILQMLQGGQPPMQPPQPGPVAPMPMGGMNPVNVPQTGLQPGQSPLMGPGNSQDMNPLASIIGNQGGPMQPQGQLNNGSAMGGDGGGGLMQIINALRSQETVNGDSLELPPDIRAMMGAMG